MHSFKVPSAEELDHDYLWRYAQRLPARGEIAIFNRSHYEEVLVVRVHPELLDRQQLPPRPKARTSGQRRYGEINDWERYLTDNGIQVVKVFLNLSKEEQRSRFLRRLDLPDKNWKFSATDVRERQYWDDYQTGVLGDAVEHAAPSGRRGMSSRPTTSGSPGRACRPCSARTLMEIDPRYPKVDAARRKDLAETRAMLEAEAPKGAAPDPFETELAGEAGQQEAGQEGKQARKQRERMAKIRAKAARA